MLKKTHQKVRDFIKIEIYLPKRRLRRKLKVKRKQNNFSSVRLYIISVH